MTGPNDNEKRLLAVSKQFDDALASADASKLKEVLGHGAVLHEDGLTLGNEIRGAEEISKYFQAYIDKYDYKHTVIAGAVDDTNYSAFSFWQDQGVKRKGRDHKPEDTVGIWYHQIDQGSLKITETFFLRQMTSEEQDRKLKKGTTQPLPGGDPLQWIKSMKPEHHAEDRCHKQKEVADKFNDIWKNGDAELSSQIMTEDVKIYDPVFGKQTSGIQEFKDKIKNFQEVWKMQSNSHRTACTHGDKGFLWWRSTGSSVHNPDAKDTLYGINMLVFDKENKIKEVVGFRQPTKNESEKMVEAHTQREFF